MIALSVNIEDLLEFGHFAELVSDHIIEYYEDFILFLQIFIV